MFFSKLLKSMSISTLIVGFSFAAFAADYNLRLTANSNDQDEDYDGAVVFKNYVEAASNGAVSVELFIGTQLCSKGAECLQGVSCLLYTSPSPRDRTRYRIPTSD